jgi:hypothetical protein
LDSNRSDPHRDPSVAVASNLQASDYNFSPADRDDLGAAA